MTDDLGSSGMDGAPGPETRPRRRAVAVRGGASARTPIVARYSRREDSASPSSRNSSVSRSTTPIPRGNYGLGSATAELRAAEEETRESGLSRFLRDRVVGRAAHTTVLDPEEEMASEESCREDPTKLGTQELRAWAGRSTASIIQLATKSSHLKGTYVKKFKEAASELQAIVEALTKRNEAEETRRLQADNNRLRSELEIIRAEQKAYRRDFTEMKTAMAKEAAREASKMAAEGASAKKAATGAPPASALQADVLEELKASIVAAVGRMLDARFAGIEERLLPERVVRPPLSSDRRGPAPPRTAGAPQAGRGLSGGLGASPASASPKAPPATAGPSRAAPQEETWSEVVTRKNRAKKTPTSNLPTATPKNPSAAAAKPKPKPNLAPPKTAAVVITLAPEAARKGVTYAQVLEQAERRVNLEELGIGAGMRIRRSATGGRLLELPKEQTQDQAEVLAERLRIALEGVAEVVRPTKTVTLRVTGLDDSATAVKVAEAVARAGGCSLTTVKATQVQTGSLGTGWSTVYCPVDAAKKVCDAGRLLVGWSSAGVQALEHRPLRCSGAWVWDTRRLCAPPKPTGARCATGVERRATGT
ncbi:translation initiation factor IF-2-like [Pararge aegeria]|uniref:translation initiation factor IF-2-like n=1 Tax=Pararge aegeria TaxID=116150 RepID=UPI0019D153FA|nr:translation initiation factor IF-2-like [Pararge aegeria]